MVKLCTYCDQPAKVRCKPHRQHLCGNSRCVRFHRWDDKEKCAFLLMNTSLFASISAALNGHRYHNPLEMPR